MNQFVKVQGGGDSIINICILNANIHAYLSDSLSALSEQKFRTLPYLRGSDISSK